MCGTVELKIRLETHLKVDGDIWVACCEPLDLCTQSDSKIGAMDALREAISGWFESCLERRVLAKALEEVGFQLVKPGDHIQSVENPANLSEMDEIVEVSVPAYIAVQLNSPNYAAR